MDSDLTPFLTAILHRGLRNDYFFFHLNQFTFSNFYLDFYFPFLFGLLFSLFSLDFYFSFLFGLLFSLYFPFLWTFISLFSLDFYSIAVTFWISFKFLRYAYPKISGLKFPYHDVYVYWRMFK